MNVPGLSEHTLCRDIAKSIIPTGPEIQVCITYSSFNIIESVDFIFRDSADTQYIMAIQTNLSKSQKQLAYKPL